MLVLILPTSLHHESLCHNHNAPSPGHQGTEKVQQLAGELEQLGTIACSQPLAPHAAFTHGMTSKWTYLTHTMPGIGPNLLPLETIIKTKLIPALTGRPPPNETEWYLFADSQIRRHCHDKLYPSHRY